VPTWHRTDRQNLSRCEAVLAQALKCHSRRVVLATDSPTLNKNLMDLANEFWATESPVEVDTLAYQAMSGVPIEADFHAIDEFDQVVFQDRAELSPPFTNQRVSEYERYIQQGRYVPVKVADDLTVYSIRCGP